MRQRAREGCVLVCARVACGYRCVVYTAAGVHCARVSVWGVWYVCVCASACVTQFRTERSRQSSKEEGGKRARKHHEEEKRTERQAGR